MCHVRRCDTIYSYVKLEYILWHAKNLTDISSQCKSRRIWIKCTQEHYVLEYWYLLQYLVPLIVFDWQRAARARKMAGTKAFFNTLERFKVCRRRRRPSSVPIKFPCKYISNDYYILVFTLSRQFLPYHVNIVQVIFND